MKKPVSMFKGYHVKVFILMLIVISLAYFTLGYLTMESVSRIYFRAKQAEAEKFAQGYLKSLDFALEADRIINELMTEKLEVTSKLTALYPNNHSDQLLHELAETYRVDQIFSYNPQGVIIHSSSGEYIGWTAPIGHPVYEFMNSDNQSFVGPIRPDTESGILYKYGYFKTQNGYFVQLGISAERIQEVIGPFERRPLLETMAEDEDAEEVCLLNEHFIIFESTNPLRLGRSISDDEIITSLQKSKQFSHIIELDGQSLFQTFIPVSHPDITAMSITFSLKDITEFQQNLTLYGTLVLLVIYALILALLISMLIKDRRLLDRAFLDSLTLLPNDQFLIEYLDKVAAHKEYYNSYLLLLECQNYLDLYTAHGFSTSNELIYTLSNKLQEIVLGQSESSHGQIFGHKLLNLINQDKKLFKYDENTFAIHVKNISEQEVVSWVSKLNTMFESGIELEGDMRFPVILKTGIVEITPDHKSEASSILREAMLALQHTKSTTRTFSLFNRTIAYQKEREETVIRELEQAIANQDSLALQFYYQPQIDIRAGSIIGFEALARFQSAAFGALSPIEFIPIAEEHHLIFALGKRLIRETCEFINELREDGLTEQKIAVNISGIQLLEIDFVTDLVGIIDSYGIDHNQLELELTESVFFENFEQLNQVISELSHQNFSLALDDFGTGYSSLARLKEVDVHIIKIDKLFVKNILKQNRDTLILPDIISMIHKLGLAVVAEGVEHPEQVSFLADHDCDIIQGYYYGKPMKKEDAKRFLQNWKSR